MSNEVRDLPRVAGNGLLDRRLFMRSLALGAAGTVASSVSFAESIGKGQPEWMLTPGATTEDYGMPSHFEMERTKRWTVPPAGQTATGRSIAALTPHHMMHGTMTPGGLHFEVNHHGIPDIDPDRHELVIHGMVRQPI
jgi:sulfane dehydrogenase subunit SoxC